MKTLKKFGFVCAFVLIGAFCMSLTSVQAQSVATTASSEAACARISMQVRKGNQGADVFALQNLLIARKHLAGGLNTGYFGSMTEQAVRDFQKTSDLEQVGYVGPRTLRAIHVAAAENCAVAMDAAAQHVAGVAFGAEYGSASSLAALMQLQQKARTTTDGSAALPYLPVVPTTQFTNQYGTTYTTGVVADNVPPLVVTCSANPNPGFTGQAITWTATVSNAVGTPNYYWLGAVEGTTMSVTNTYNSVGTRTSMVTVSTGSQVGSANCSVMIMQAAATTTPLMVTCSANPTMVLPGHSVTWTSQASGGLGNYAYQWVIESVPHMNGSLILPGQSVVTTYNQLRAVAGNVPYVRGTVWAVSQSQSAGDDCNVYLLFSGTSTLPGIPTDGATSTATSTAPATTTPQYRAQAQQYGQQFGIPQNILFSQPVCTVTDVSQGDLNNDGTVNWWDLVLLGRNYGLPAGQLLDPSADKNGDWRVNFFEALKVAQHFGKTNEGCPTNRSASFY